MNKFAEINVVTFDADGTLWDFEKVMRHSLHQTLLELNRIDAETAALLDVDKMITIRNRVANELTGKISNLSEIRLEAFKQTFKDISRPDDALAVHLNAVFFKHRFQDIELFDDVLPVLDILRHRYILVMLSNSNSDPEFCGLPGIFRFVVLAQDYGAWKPDPKIFQIALEKAACSQRELLHIGDTLEEDILGATNAGVKNIWLNRNPSEGDPGYRVEHQISSLRELLDIL